VPQAELVLTPCGSRRGSICCRRALLVPCSACMVTPACA
jgi:hypothetical protein